MIRNLVVLFCLTVLAACQPSGKTTTQNTPPTTLPSDTAATLNDSTMRATVITQNPDCTVTVTKVPVTSAPCRPCPPVSTPPVSPPVGGDDGVSSGNLIRDFAYEATYGPNYNPQTKFGSFSLNDGIPTVFDYGYAWLGRVWSPDTQWWNLGFSHATERAYLNTEWPRFGQLPKSRKAYMMYVDREIFEDTYTIDNMTVPQMKAKIDVHFSWNLANNNVDLFSIDYERSDPRTNPQYSKWEQIIDYLRTKTGFPKMTWYGMDSKRTFIYSGFPESYFWDGPPEEFYTTLDSRLDYENHQVYVGEPLSRNDPKTLREMLAHYEITNKHNPDKSLCTIKHFQENYGEGGQKFNATKQIAQGFALIPKFTKNGFWGWGTEGLPIFGPSLDDFLEGLRAFSQLNDIANGQHVPIIPTIKINGQTFGNWANYLNAMDPTQPNYYSAWVVGEQCPVLVRGIRNGDRGALCMTRIGGAAAGTDTVEVTVGDFTQTYTLTGRNWYVYRISGIGNN